MGRRKKHNLSGDNHENSKNEERKELIIHGDAKRSVAAIFLFALAVIFVLGYFEVAAALGRFLNKILSYGFGWGKWVLPLVLIITGIVLLYRKETIFYVTKITGLSIVFLSLLGFFHLYNEPTKILLLAKTGTHGGYVGYGISWLLLKLTGVYAGTVILLALMIIGMIVAFNFSIVNLFQKMTSLISLIRKKEESKIFVGEEVSASSSVPDNDVLKQKEEEKNICSKDDKKNKEEDNVWIEEESKPDLSFMIKPITGNKVVKRAQEKKLVSSRSWQFPPLDLLELATGKAHGGDVSAKAKIIHDTLRNFGIKVEIGEILVGPTVTQFSIRPAVGVKLSKITALNNDLALALAAHPIRIEAPIPGKSLVGIEVPNRVPALVKLRNLLESQGFKNRKSNLTLALGEDVSGNYIFSDLKKMPHLMIAGSTGAGKSVCVNAIILSLLYQNSPDDLRLVMIDPKRVELSLYNGIPHLLADAIVENGKALNAFKWAIGEMERRYRLFQETASRDLESYNRKAREGETRKYTNEETGEIVQEKLDKLPYIVIIIDELADLMSSHGKEVEGAIIRLAQMARAVGIHLIVSTQRPSVEVLTGLIKANITNRIAFKVATQIDSRTILDTSGAEKLLGSGDMLLLSSQSSKPKRIQGVLVSEEEVKRVVNFIKEQNFDRRKEELEGEAEMLEETIEKMKFDYSELSPENEDPLYPKAKEEVIQAGKASTSFLQRRLRIGYARAARLIDMLEEQGVVGPGEGSKPREILMKKNETGLIGSLASKEKDDYGKREDFLEEDMESEKIIEESEKEDDEIEREIKDQTERDKWQI